MQALSGLTPALSRRLQRQLLAHLPPRAAARLRRTLSLHADAPAPAPVPAAEPASAPATAADGSDPPAPQYCTLPRSRRPSAISVESDSTNSLALENTTTLEESKTDSPRRTQDRPLLSKYLAPERNLSMDESYSLDSGSILSDPSYIAAYGTPSTVSSPGLTFRRHSLRLSGDQPKKRISRFLRSDFFDAPSDESLYAKHKKEKELETQKILREIREKKNKSLESNAKSPTEISDVKFGCKDESSTKTCLSPISNIILKERSRSNTPFFPILDNIKETALDSSALASETKPYSEKKDNIVNKESKMVRPKSYPIKHIDQYDDINNSMSLESCRSNENDTDDKKANKESKLIRPKSYPASSPSPEKIILNRVNNKDESKHSEKESISPETKTDVEVSFSITLPKKTKPLVTKSDSQKKIESTETSTEKTGTEPSLTLKKYKVINTNINDITDSTEDRIINNNGSALGSIHETKSKGSAVVNKKDTKVTSPDDETTEKKNVVKKKVIKKVSSKSKTDLSSTDANGSKTLIEKKKVTKKVKEKTGEDSAKTSTVPKKKSVLQSIGHKLEKFTSSKSNSPEKISNVSNHVVKPTRAVRENSVPANVEPPTESNLIKRAVTITDVAALENQNNNHNKTTVSKVLGLFKKFEPKEKISKSNSDKLDTEQKKSNYEFMSKDDETSRSTVDLEDKPKRPNSLLLNGLGRKNRYARTSSDDGNTINVDNNERQALKKDSDTKNVKNSLKLDFSRLPRVKKIVPTNSVIEPQIMNMNDIEKDTADKGCFEKNGSVPDGGDTKEDSSDAHRSRSRSRSTYSNSDVKSEQSADGKDKHSSTNHLTVRNHDSTTPEKEDIVERIRRKSFYSRFNEKKQRRKSSLVGPGATEYDPLARITSPISTEPKYDISPSSPVNYDLSPGLSVGSDISPSTERYRSLLADLPVNTRSSLRYDGINDKVDMYRSLDRNDFRKYPGRSYLDYDQPASYNSSRYSRTKSLFDSSDPAEDQTYGLPRESQKYSRTSSLFSPGSYATYRPKKTRNSAIILKESEKEPSPENILEKIRQRKYSISVTRKPDPEKDPMPRSHVPPKGEGDGSERSAKID